MSDQQSADKAGIIKVPRVEEQMHFMLRQAELLDEQGHDVSAQVMRDCAAVLAKTARELEQQTNFKYKANLRADKAEAELASARSASAQPLNEALAFFVATAFADGYFDDDEIKELVREWLLKEAPKIRDDITVAEVMESVMNPREYVAGSGK